METLQIRLSKGVVEKVDALVEQGLYSSRSDAVRDATRKLVFDVHSLVGIIPNTGDSVKEVREIRKKLSSQINSFSDIEEINKLAD